ncbi:MULTISPECIES: hypothetical protein [Peribacillus]|uniref:hypothetical protein n=1 Tax=Peribacillus TaxID=2675229 RepID=UPI001F4E1291|nr:MULTISPECIES: hypothetical protein [unclassified Peribacillus]MCK1985183.1 hypothetical protein [Peribacillus sp. Aquil_B1]MCK2007167.1 hypothetical protein [Peribacillus sp. Aquil_B8]
MNTLSIIEVNGKWFCQSNEELTLVHGEKRLRRKHLIDGTGKVVAKCCSICDEMKIATNEFFRADDRRFTGLQAKCKSCHSAMDAVNKTGASVRGGVKKTQKPRAERFYNEDGECIAKVCPGCSKRKERSGYRAASYNHDGMFPYCTDCTTDISNRVSSQNARAISAGLPGTLTAKEWENTLEVFGGKCALTGEDIDLSFEHAVPVSKNGGTTAYNCYPVSATLNRSKFTKHLFKWAETAGVDSVRFDKLVKHLADHCDMTPAEYRDFYDWAYESTGDVSLRAYKKLSYKSAS